MDRRALTPVQRKVIDKLLAPDAPRPEWDELVALRLIDALEEGVAPLVDDLGPGDLTINKGALTKVHQCEQHFVSESEARFAWSTATARGAVAHRALQLSLTMRDAAPLELVDEAVARITSDGDDWTPRDFLRAATPGQVAELCDAANDLVAKFQECFPPLLPSWRPRVESALRVELCGARIQLRAKVDLALDRAMGHEARVVIVDFKSGRPHAGHLDDLRFYALVEAIRLGVPPFRVAVFYLDAARWQHEDVTSDTLAAAVRRVIGGATKLASLRYGERDPSITPGPACSYCRLREGCPGAEQWTEQRLLLGVD